MVNHVRTLILNMGASELEKAGTHGWMCDPAYRSVDAGRAAESLRSALFSSCRTAQDRMDVVSAVMPFLLDPEFEGHMNAYDTRITVSSDRWPERVERGTVRSFYSSMRRMGGVDIGGIVSSCLGLDLANGLFSHVGTASVDDRLDDLKTRYTCGIETSRRFSAALHALAARTEHARLAGRAM